MAYSWPAIFSALLAGSAPTLATPPGPTPSARPSPSMRPVLAAVPLTTDQVLTERDRELFIEVAPPETGLLNARLELTLPDGARADLGFARAVDAPSGAGDAQIGVPRVRFTARVPDARFDSLSRAFAQQIATLTLTSGGQPVARSYRARVFIGGAYDRACARPVLISDFHGTLDTGDRCTASALNALTGERRFTVVVISSAGVRVAHDLARLGFAHPGQFLVLDDVGQGAHPGSAVEKALRAARALLPAGACLAGFVSEDPGREGRSASMLNIPYVGAGTYGLPPGLPRGSFAAQDWCAWEEQMRTRWGLAPAPSNNDSSNDDHWFNDILGEPSL